MIKLPEMREELKIEIKKDDNDVLEFEAIANQSDVEVVFSTPTHLIHCSHSLLAPSNKNRPPKRYSSVRNSDP